MQATEFNKKEDDTPQRVETLPEKRQKDKVLATINTGDYRLLSSEGVEVNDEQREIFLKDIARGNVEEDDFQELLWHIEAPVHRKTPDELYGSVSSHDQMTGIVANFIRGNLRERENLNSSDLVEFLEKYPDPYSLMKKIPVFFDEIESQNSSKKREEYNETLERFMGIVYGKRYEYYKRIEDLKNSADQKYPELAEEREMKREEEEKRVKNVCKDIESYDNPEMVVGKLKEEYERMFKEMKRKKYQKYGDSIGEEVLKDKKYRRLVRENEVVKNAENKIMALRGDSRVSPFMNMERDVLKEVQEEESNVPNEAAAG